MRRSRCSGIGLSPAKKIYIHVVGEGPMESPSDESSSYQQDIDDYQSEIHDAQGEQP